MLRNVARPVRRGVVVKVPNGNSVATYPTLRRRAPIKRGCYLEGLAVREGKLQFRRRFLSPLS